MPMVKVTYLIPAEIHAKLKMLAAKRQEPLAVIMVLAAKSYASRLRAALAKGA